MRMEPNANLDRTLLESSDHGPPTPDPHASGDGPRMEIAVDFDGVLFDHVPYVLRGFRDAYGIDLGGENLRHWDFFQYQAVREAGLTEACVRSVLDRIETDPALHEMPPRDPFAARVMDAWKQAGHQVDVVTARGEISREVTRRFLHTNEIPYDDLVMEAEMKTGWDVLIDDAAHNVLAAAEEGSRALLMDHPYNRDVDASTNPARVHDWVDVAHALPGPATGISVPR